MIGKHPVVHRRHVSFGNVREHTLADIFSNELEEQTTFYNRLRL